MITKRVLDFYLDHFLANLVFLHHARTVVSGYELMMHKNGKLAGGMKKEVLYSNLDKQFISKILLKLWIDHGGEGVILDSHGEGYLTMLGKDI